MADAAIEAVDLAAARAVPGVVAAFVMADLAAVLPAQPLPLDRITNRDGTVTPVPARPALAAGRVRFAGEAIALVVAVSEAAAADGAEAVAITYDTRPAAAVHAGVPDNIGFDWAGGDAAAVAAAFARASLTVAARVAVPRILGAPLEPAAALASYDPTAQRWTLMAPTQGVHAFQRELAVCYLGVAPERLRVVTPDVGGAFGLRIHALPEHAALLGAARLLDRPVLWRSDRMESHLCEPHARDMAVDAELALDAAGGFLGLRAAAVCGLGAYVHPGGRATPTASLLFGLQGAYRMPAVSLSVRGMYSHATPTGPFRGAGQPEGTYVIERLIDQAADRLGISPLELRRRNVLTPADFPFRCATGHTVGSGDPGGLLRRAADWLGARPDPPGLSASGLALYLKVNGMGRQERAEVAVTAAGTVIVRIGSQSNGQGHASTFAGMAAARLGIDPALIQVVQGDTDSVAFGTGTGASSALVTTGAGVAASSDDLLRQARAAAAQQLEVAADALDYQAGQFGLAGSNRFVSLAQLAAAAGGALVGRSEVGVNLTYTFGCHACTVRVDADTGAVQVCDYVAFDDLGPLLQPAIAAGQIHGGVAQGIGQALLEAMQYDAGGQPLSASLLDYALPRASDLPGIHCVPVVSGPGIRGAGEAGAVASMAAVVNAVAAAVGDTGLDAPLTPERVWRALQNSRVTPGLDTVHQSRRPGDAP
jgi:carbon-monoxide dehydrogenase large subunit